MSLTKTGMYCVVDTETTGIHPSRHRVIQLAALVLDADFRTLDTLNLDIHPTGEYDIEPISMKINGFTMERIEQGIPAPEACKQFYQFITKYFETQPIYVGQFFAFDYAFLDALFWQVGMEKEFDTIFKNRSIDTKSLALAANAIATVNGSPLPFPVTSLSNKGGLKDTLGVDSSTYQAHDALGDVFATRDIFIKLIQTNELNFKSLEQMH